MLGSREAIVSYNLGLNTIVLTAYECHPAFISKPEENCSIVMSSSVFSSKFLRCFFLNFFTSDFVLSRFSKFVYFS